MTTYKPHYACFECRKTFKRILLKDIKRGVNDNFDAKCPQCGELMANMGLDFESPRKSDLKFWQHIKSLYTVGITFHSCGCSGPGYIPRTKEKLLEYLDRRKQEYVKNLQFWLNRKTPTTKKEIADDLKETGAFRSGIAYSLSKKGASVKPQTAIDFWNEKLSELEKRMQRLHID